MKKYSVIVFTILMNSLILAQTDTLDSNIDIDDMLEESTQDQETSQLLDNLEYFKNNPIDINTTSISNLSKLPFLTQADARGIIRYRNKLGGFNSIDQFEKIDVINHELVLKILPFIKLENDNSIESTSNFFTLFNGMKISIRSRMMEDLKMNAGFTDNKFTGTKPKVYNRMLYIIPDIFEAGFLFEKDAGENTYSDFSSFHFNFKNVLFFKDLIVGDYNFEFGQGLAVWSPYAFSKGSDAVGSVMRNARTEVPYRSADENNFMRGAAARIDINNFSASVFFSKHKIDASVDSSTNLVTSLKNDGYHRTENEISKHRNLNENIIGITTSYSFGETLNLGLLYYRSGYDHSFEIDENPFLSENRFEYLSTAYNIFFKHLFITGEISKYKSVLSSINTIRIVPDKNFSIVFSYRDYSKDYFSIHGNAFGERGNPTNESGFYTGIYFRTWFGTFNFYYDQFKYPTANSSIDFPSNGNEYLINYTFKPIKNIEYRMRYKNESKEIPLKSEITYVLRKQRIQKLRVELIDKLSKKIRLRIRFNPVFVSPQNEKGLLLFTDINYKPSPELSIAGRIIFFRTDSYDSRVYEFENDLTGVISNPALFGEGSKWYIIFKYKSKIGATVSFKYSELFKPNDRTIGSGYNQINGPLNNKIGLQIDWNF